MIVFGAMALGDKAARTDEKARTAALHAAFEAGVSAVDTAPLYEFGLSEELVGRAVRGWNTGRSDRVRIFTKVGLRWDDPRGELLFELTDDRTGARYPVRKNSRPDSVRLEVERSSKRLGVEVIDLVQVHHRDAEVPIADTIGALLDLRREGKLLEIGVCNYSAPMIREAAKALGDVPLAAVQCEYNVLSRGVEAGVLPAAIEAGAGVFAYSPLAKGLLGGLARENRAYPRDDYRGFNVMFRASNRARINAAIDRAAKEIAADHQATVAQVMIAWILGQRGVKGVIAGARWPAQARENARAADVKLDAEERWRIARAFEGLTFDLGRERRGVAREQLSRLRRVIGRVIRRA